MIGSQQAILNMVTKFIPYFLLRGTHCITFSNIAGVRGVILARVSEQSLVRVMSMIRGRHNPVTGSCS